MAFWTVDIEPVAALFDSFDRFVFGEARNDTGANFGTSD
jgi:hypothetical protein